MISEYERQSGDNGGEFSVMHEMIFLSFEAVWLFKCSALTVD